jgi:hypothetical protein
VDQLTAPARAMQSELVKLKAQLAAAEDAVKATEKALAQIKRSKTPDLGQFKSLTKQLEQEKSVVSALTHSIGAYTQANDGANESMTSAVTKGTILGNVYVKLGEYALKAAAAVAEFAMAGFSLALSATEAKNDTLDTLDAFLETSEEVDYVYNSIIDMGGRVAISVAKGSDIARQLAAAGNLTATQIVDSIESIGMVTSVLGSGAGDKIQSIIEQATATGTFKISGKQLKGTGVTTEMLAKQLGVDPKTINDQLKKGQITAEKGISALTAAVNNKFAGLAGKQVLDFSSQMMRLKDNVTRLFEDVQTEGFLSSLKEVLSVFDQNTVAGTALKEVVTSVFSGLFKVVEAVAPFVKAFLKGMIIIALQVYIAFKPLIKTIRDAFGGDNTAAVTSFAGAFSAVGEWLARTLPFLVSYAQTLVGFLIPAFKLLWSVISPIVTVLGAVMTAFLALSTTFQTFILQAFTFGTQIVQGLIDGIKSMASAPVDAIKGIASSALSAFKGVFGIASPSKVMGQMGGHLMSGLEQGVDKNASGPEAALSESVAPPALGGGASGGSRSVVLNVEAGAIQINTSGGAQQIAADLPGLLANVFEQAMIEVGGAKAA